MTAKMREVALETGHFVLYWTCPNCSKENTGEFKREFDFIEEIECECGTTIKRQGDIRWFITE